MGNVFFLVKIFAFVIGIHHCWPGSFVARSSESWGAERTQSFQENFARAPLSVLVSRELQVGELWLLPFCVTNNFSCYFKLVSTLCSSKYCLLAPSFPGRMDQIACESVTLKGLQPASHSARRELGGSLWDCQGLSWDVERRETKIKF